MANFSESKNKFKHAYPLSPFQGIAKKVALTSRFLNPKIVEYDALNVGIEFLNWVAGADQTESQKTRKA